MIEITKQQGMFCLHHIIRSYMLSQGWGKNTEFYGWCFSIKEFYDLERHISQMKLPTGYYNLCDMLGESYSVEVNNVY